MSNPPKRTPPALVLIVLLVAGVAMAAPGAGDVGTPAPDFNLQVFGGGTQSLSQHTGKVVLLFIIGYA